MSNYNRVLIPIDLTPGVGPLTPAVRRLIDTNESEITLLHVVESQPWLGRNSHTVRLMTELELLAHRQFRGARISRRIEWGRPADCILNVIRTAGMDAVLLSAGYAPMGTNALGPVVTEVLAEAPCPVLLEWAITAPVNRARTQPVCCASRVRRKRGSRIERGGVGGRANGGATENRVCAPARWLPAGPALGAVHTGARSCSASFADRGSARPLGARFRRASGCRAAGFGVQPCHPLAWRGTAGDRRFPRGTAVRRNRNAPYSTSDLATARGPNGRRYSPPGGLRNGGEIVRFRSGRRRHPRRARHTFREQVAGTVKVILLTGGLLGGLWLLQMIAKN